MMLITFEVTPARVRNAANVSSKRDISTTQAENFIDMFKDEIEKALQESFRTVVARHFSEGK